VPATAELEQLAIDTIRVLSMDAVQKANSGHPGAPMGLAPLGYVLYTQVLRHDPADSHWPNRDRFVLSGGHGCALQYSLLHLCGYDLTLDDLKSFRQLGSRTPGHPEYGITDGIEATTGPLGQGIGNAVGFAIAETRLSEMFNRDGAEIVDWRTYFQCGDGDMQEGVASEAASLAGSLGLGKLIGVYDSNHIQIEGSTDLAFHEQVAERFEAYGWQIQTLGVESTPDDIRVALEQAGQVKDMPSLIVLRTHIAHGSPNKQDTAGAHGAPLGEDEVKLTKENLGFPSLDPFFVPDGVRELFAAVRERGAQLHAEWDARYRAWAEAHADLAGDFERLLTGGVPQALADASTPTRAAGSKPVATRSASGEALNWLKDLVPELLGGSADLAPSNETHLEGEGDYLRHQFDGRNLHFGVREHAMGAIVNGMTLCGLRAYGGTFLTFSDYMRGSIRLSALMEIPSLFVFTHDSIGLGEDGPTHQPIEQLAALRAMPNIEVIRPADVNESFQAWRWAVTRADQPSALVFTRQKLPVLDPERIPADAIERGAYVYADPDAEPDLLMIGTGSEVSLCIDAAALLAEDGIVARVVSMPSFERFAAQPADYRDAVLPPSLTARVSVEMGSSFGWDRWVGEQGVKIGIDSFGASGPIADLLAHFGFTPEAVAERVKSTLG
jgi:transketolase